MYKLRYYTADTANYKTKNDAVLNLLELIKHKHGIDYEVVPFRLTKLGDGYYVDESHEKEIYESHFKPRARLLNQRIGASIRLALRSQRGRGHYYLAGTVAILEDGEIGWFTSYESARQFKGAEEDQEVGFLKALLERGVLVLDELCTPLQPKGYSEERLVSEFIREGLLKGRFEREVKAGSSFFSSGETTFDWRKSIDLVYHTGRFTWVLEAKKKLNWEAFGQVIAYSYLYEKESGMKVKKGIICELIDHEILALCREFGIAVFMKEDSKFVQVEAQRNRQTNR